MANCEILKLREGFVDGNGFFSLHAFFLHSSFDWEGRVGIFACWWFGGLCRTAQLARVSVCFRLRVHGGGLRLINDYISSQLLMVDNGRYKVLPTESGPQDITCCKTLRC